MKSLSRKSLLKFLLTFAVTFLVTIQVIYHSNLTDPSNAKSLSGTNFIFPLSTRDYVITSVFGPRWGRNHNGVDLAANEGTPIKAAVSGTTFGVGDNGDGYGRVVEINHGGFTTLYAHMSEIAVSSGAQVRQGQLIGYVGSTGNSTGPHLHFEVRLSGNPIDPQPYLSGSSNPTDIIISRNEPPKHKIPTCTEDWAIGLCQVGPLSKKPSSATPPIPKCTEDWAIGICRR
jgi:murein DD-endopeptidase MepM/ murein hydrolase activator NlpD